MPSNQRDQELADMSMRLLSVRANTFNEDQRSVEATISTESPVEMVDWHRMEMVPEVLLASGVQFPKSRQVPFLDSHQRRSVKDQLGSARDIKVDDGQVAATLYFRKSGEANDALDGVRDGHITDVSVGYDVLKRTYIAKGDTKTIAGRSFEGPVNVVTKWRLREVSLTPIGADTQAKLRGLNPAALRFQSSEEKESFTMQPELRALLVSKGMPDSHTDEQAQRWLVDNADKLGTPKKEEPKEERSLPTAADLAKLVADATRTAIAEQEATRKKFEGDVRDLCELAEVPEAVEACRGLESLEAVRAHIKKIKAEQAATIPYGGSVRVLSSGIDRLKTDIRAALVAKACYSGLNGDGAKLDKYLPADQRKAAESFQHATLLDMATEFVRAMGVQTFGLTRDQIAICAMFGPDKAGIRQERSAYHHTGSFANITLDAINKSMMIGYGEVPATWRGPMKQGQSVSDFKSIHRTQIGAIPNLPVWNDTDRPEMASMADAKETYAVEARSIGIDFGYKLIVNDDMSALTNTPRKLGDAAARTVNSVAWSQVTSNPTMRDGQTLFLETPAGNRKRKNLTTGAGSPSVSTVGTLKALMRLMRGENTPEGNESADILNLTPSYIVVPAALETTAEQLVNSVYDPANSSGAAFNPTRSLKPVVEPLLDAASTTAWYLFADPGRIETVEVTFLAGQETPQVRTVMDEHTLATTYYVLQSVAAKALDHRGVQKHAGA